MKKIILIFGAIIFLSCRMPTLAATSCQGKSDCPSGYECVYWDNSGTPRIDSLNNAENAFCAKIYQEVTRVPTKKPTNPVITELAKEGEFCGAGPNGVVRCAPGLKCDESRNTIDDDSGVVKSIVGAGGICVKITPTSKPTPIDNCRVKVCGDANCDGVINSLDLTIWRKENMEQKGNSADFNNDNKVDRSDYDLLALGLQKKCSPESQNPVTELAKEGEFCGAGPNGVVRCAPGLKCDESRNTIDDDSGVVKSIVGAGGICVKITPTSKPTPIDNCRVKVCGDANCDGKVDYKDRLVWMRERLTSSRTADFNKDGKVDSEDYSILTRGIRGECQPTPVPRIVTPIPTKKLLPTVGPVISGRPITSVPKPSLTPIARKKCETNDDCVAPQVCYQPPMPTCPSGQGCLDVMPAKYCREITKVTTLPSGKPTITRPTGSLGCDRNGDGDGDGAVTLKDYAAWRYEYSLSKAIKSDFNCDRRIDKSDYEIWKKAFLSTRELTVPTEN